ncbi:hypothetical protein BXZ70DRAFT_417776 [Cristinia sonorae]|uniref:Uncharacterized protein n=1 Tax=Cristinia sonorae TaxID=1940300 RepID=A0A8K0UXI8_9AGAR|nr:hypothetical protein BXZ70DRAFT_417776 [Cristinia sonorae]
MISQPAATVERRGKWTKLPPPPQYGGAMATIFPRPSPSLPPFKTLLIQGPYHPSAPLHLCLSHSTLSPTNSALVISPSRSKLQAALKESNEGWLYDHGGDGTTCSSSTRVQLLYPPTASHLALVLTSLHEANVAGKSAYIPKVTFDVAPTLVVLCELSSYVTDDSASTVSSYLTLVTQALTSAATLSTNS